MNSLPNLRTRYQMLLGLQLFFPVIFDAISNAANNQSTFSELTLKWGLVIGLSLFSYLLMEFLSHTFPAQIIFACNISVVVEASAYGLVLIVISLLVNDIHSVYASFYMNVYSVGVACLVFIPIIRAFSFFFYLIYKMLKNPLISFYNLLKRK